MMNRRFSDWVKWNDRNGLVGNDLPGVYAIARCDKDISGSSFEWHQDIIYVGMTNSKGGLKSRLQQFENTIAGEQGHGGALRVINKYPDYQSLVPLLYVSVLPVNCNVSSNLPTDLRTMGDVAKLEYECFAQFFELFGKLPEFNDKQRSPKKKNTNEKSWSGKIGKLYKWVICSIRRSRRQSI